MKETHWLWCLHCQRCFRVIITDPGSTIGPQWFEELEEQLGGQLKCPYEGCDGNPFDFRLWSKYRETVQEGIEGRVEPQIVPEIPEVDTVYPLDP